MNHLQTIIALLEDCFLEDLRNGEDWCDFKLRLEYLNDIFVRCAIKEYSVCVCEIHEKKD